MVDVIDGDLERLDFAQTFVAVLIRDVTSQTREAVVDGLNATSLARVPETRRCRHDVDDAVLECVLQDSMFPYMCMILNKTTSLWHLHVHSHGSTSGSYGGSTCSFDIFTLFKCEKHIACAVSKCAISYL